jgi:asparagine synthase (glutamine-hydrolysing)
MCGIAGVLVHGAGATADPGTVQAMCDAIVHRGPDDQGLYVSGPVGIGMRRLSIIDVAGGHQPMQTEDGRFTIVYNGEIYNHREVRAKLEARGHHFRTNCDTEVVLRAFVERGPESLEWLNGMFAIAIWDAERRELFLARDRVGIKPLYVVEGRDRLTFASELKALLVAKDVPREIDLDALNYFLRYGYVPWPATLWKHVRQVPPGHYLVAGPGGVTQRSFWSLGYAPAERPTAEHEQEARVGLQAAVARQLVSDVPLGAFLSGGFDSSSVVASMRTASHGGSLATYAIGFGGADRFHSELEDAARISKHFGTDHHEILVEPDAVALLPKLVRAMDQPLADSSFIVTYLVSELARQTVTVILSGVGGDEIFGGYRRYLGPRLARHYDRVPAFGRRAVAMAVQGLPVDRGSTVRNYTRLARNFVASHGLEPFEQYDRAVAMLDEPSVARLCPAAAGRGGELAQMRRGFFDEPDTDDPVTRMMHLDLKTSLVDSLLLLTDRMSMATSLEVRVPFLDHTYVEAVARIPSSLKVRGTKLRYVQKESMRSELPAEVYKKKKRGFGVPVGAWFRRSLRPMLHDTLSPERLARQGLFAPAAVAGIIREHEEQRADHSDLLLALLTFQLWHDEWVAA